MFLFKKTEKDWPHHSDNQCHINAFTLIVDVMVHGCAVSHSMHCADPRLSDTAAAADNAVQGAAVLGLHRLHTELGVHFALSAVKCHMSHS